MHQPCEANIQTHKRKKILTGLGHIYVSGGGKHNIVQIFLYNFAYLFSTVIDAIFFKFIIKYPSIFGAIFLLWASFYLLTIV